MSNIRDMVDAISSDNFDGARGALKASLAEYMAGKKYLSNEDVFGSEYNNPNKEEQKMKDELTEGYDYTDVEGEYKCNDCGAEFNTTDHHHAFLDNEGDIMCPECKSTNVKFLEE